MTPVMPGAVNAAAVSPDVALANRVRKAIAEKIGAEPAKAVSVEVISGVVTLRGTTSADVRAAAEAATMNVAGVQRVANQISTQ